MKIEIYQDVLRAIVRLAMEDRDSYSERATLRLEASQRDGIWIVSEWAPRYNHETGATEEWEEKP